MTRPTRLPKHEITKRLATLNGSLRAGQGWRYAANALCKEFVLGSFTGAAKFIQKIAPRANALDHHPNVQLYRYKRVKIRLTTHDAGGITRKDFQLAAIINELAPR